MQGCNAARQTTLCNRRAVLNAGGFHILSRVLIREVCPLRNKVECVWRALEDSMDGHLPHFSTPHRRATL